MNNIHILPTDKPSRLGYIFESESYHIFKKGENANDIADNLAHYRNIYITSDEEIKEGDWVYSEARKTLFKVKSIFNTSAGYLLIEDDVIMPLEINEVDCKKIILTTDQDLIKDGVQCIDDEFLEWFVKNPSCEEVKLENHVLELGYNHYKIIIPKEEPKQIKCYCGHTITCDCGPLEEPKQETLEEAAERYADYSNDYVPMSFGDKFNETTKRDFIAGAKWQQERSYSEEDMRKAFIAGGNSNITEDDGYGSRYLKYMDIWFEQFKKE